MPTGDQTPVPDPTRAGGIAGDGGQSPSGSDVVASAVMVASALRPRFRGVLHRWAAVASVVLFTGLWFAAHDMGSRVVVAVYGCCVTAMLGVSAVYHSGSLSPMAVRRFKRLDHATILLAIAGTYTAVIALALEGTTRAVLLVVVWAAALIGIAIRMVWLDAPYPLVAVVYLVVAWGVALIDVGAFLRALSGGQMALVVTGGLLYSSGAIVYAVRRPDPLPAVFGYHEVFHALVVGGAGAHYLAVLAIVRAG